MVVVVGAVAARRSTCTPLPWWTSQSTISTLSTPSLCRATAAATGTLLSRQNPIACRASQWWPGGRTTANALSSSPEATRVTSSTTEPAESSAARPEASAEKYLRGVEGESRVGELRAELRGSNCAAAHVSLSMPSAAFASPSVSYVAVEAATSSAVWTSARSAAAAGRTGTSFARAARPRRINSS